jgi:histidinol phosphatase-like enzyme (inositol monophosphatase family)
MDYSRELSEALKAAEKAGRYIRKSEQQLPAIEAKADRSPVTEIDRTSESIIRDHLLAFFKTDGFLGEESGEQAGASGRRWIVDPLDGTRPYLRNIPTYSVLISLEDNNVPVVGVIHLPALDCTCWASKGGGAYLNNIPIHVSNCRTLKTAFASALGFVEKADTGSGQSLFRLMQSWDYTYGFMDAYTYICVARGSIDIVVNLLDKPWDCASAACIVTEAGGRFSDIRGIPSVHNGSIILSNGALHEEALAYFSHENL